MKKLASPFERRLAWVKTRQCHHYDLGYQKNPRHHPQKLKLEAGRLKRRNRQRVAMRTTRWTKIPNSLWLTSTDTSHSSTPSTSNHQRCQQRKSSIVCCLACGNRYFWKNIWGTRSFFRNFQCTRKFL